MKARVWLPARRSAAGLAATAAALTCAAAGLASGGTSIASAPVVPVGQQEFGDTAKVPQNSYGYSKEFWKLPLRAGDRVRIDWEEATGTEVRLYVYPPSTTDYTMGSTYATFEQGADANGKNELVFAATGSGTWPLVFASSAISAETPGSYDFVVYVQHQLRLFLPALSSLGRRAVVRVGVHAPDGTPLTAPALRLRLEANWRAGWRTIASASPHAGVAVFHLAVPANVTGRILLRVRASGASYLPALSTERSVAIH